MHPNVALAKAFFRWLLHVNGRTNSQQLSPPAPPPLTELPSLSASNFGSDSRSGSLLSCLIFMSLSSICNGNFTIPNKPFRCFRPLLPLLRHRFSPVDADRTGLEARLDRVEVDSDLNNMNGFLFFSLGWVSSRLMTLPQKTTSFGTLDLEIAVGNSKSKESVPS